MTSSRRPQRIMHIISGDLWAGAEVQVYTLLKFLRDEVALHIILLNEGELANRLRLLDIEITILPENKLNSLAIIRQLTSALREFRPDVIHTHRQKENILGNIANVLAFPLSKNRPKSIRTAHGAPEFAPKGKQKIQVWLDTWVANHLQQVVIAVSEDLAHKLKAVFHPEKIHVVQNGVDCEALVANAAPAEFKKQLPLHKHVGIVGRVEPVKRIDIFLEMAAQLLANKNKTTPLQFHVIGDGGLQVSMKQKAVELGIEKQVFFHGHRSDIPSCIFSLDVMVMCSDHEGTPMAALEALALGTTLIAHDVGGLHELLINYPEKRVLDHTPKGYATSVDQAIHSDFSKMILEEKYTAKSNVRSMLAIYEKTARQ